MPLGEEVGDAYIEVHADTSSFRRELQREAKAAGAAAGRDFGNGMDSELDDQMSRLGRRLRKSLTEAGVQSGIGFQEGLADAVGARMRRFTANLQESMVSGDWTRVLGDFDSLDKGIDAVEMRLESLRAKGAITQDQFTDAAKSLERWFSAVKNDEAEQGLKRMTDDISAFGEDFAREAERVNKELEKIGKNRATKRLKRDLDLSDFEGQMKKINDDYMKEFADNVQGLSDDLSDVNREAVKLADTLDSRIRSKKLKFDIDSSAWDKAFEEAGASAEKFQADLVLQAGEAEHRITEGLKREYAARRELNEDFINDRMEFWDREIAGAVNSEKAMQRWTRNAEKEMARLRKAFTSADTDWLDTEAMERSLNKFADSVDRTYTRVGKSSDRLFIGKLKGSRNDFLNIIGSMGGALERLIGRGFDGAFRLAGGAISSFGDTLSKQDGIIGKFGGKLQGLGDSVAGLAGKGGWVGLAVAVAGFGAALAAIIPIAGAVVAGIYGISGAIVALGVSLGGAVIGALLSLGPLVLALGAGAGAAALGILGMTDAMKDGLQPIKDWYENIKGVVAEELFSNLEDQVSDFTEMLNGLEPILTNSAGKIREFVDEMLMSFGTQNMKNLLEPLQVTLPEILDNLLGTIRYLSTGFAGLFAAISPVVEEVTGKIEGAAKAFSDWATTEPGQKEIRDFFEKTAIAAESLWKIAGNVWDILKVLFEEGNETGQQFLDKIVELTDEFAEWLGSTEGRAELQQWFEYAKEVATELGDVIGALKDLWDELNTPTNREFFLVILNGVEGLITGLAELTGWLDRTFSSFNTWALNLGPNATRWGVEIVNGFRQGISDTWNSFTAWWEEKWNGFVAWFKDFFGIASPSRLFAGFGADLLNGMVVGFGEAWASVTAWWNETALPFFNSLPEKIGAALEAAWDFLWSPIGERWAKVQEWWNSTAQPWLIALPGKAEAAFTQFWSWLFSPLTNAWARVKGWWDGTAYPFLQSLPGLAKAQFDRLWNMLPSGISQGWAKVRNWWNGEAYPFFSGLPGRLVNIGERMITSILEGIKSTWWRITSWLSNAVGNIRLTIPTPRISMPNLPWMASGGIANGPRVVGIGEAGAEAVVPLNRPLSQVDPSVRWLSAIAQGKNPVNAGSGSSGGITVAPGAINVQSNFADSRLVAEDVLSGLVSRFK